MAIVSVLSAIQLELKAPKNQKNTFGKYNYRSCEDILEAVKPLLEKNSCALVLNDDLVLVGDRYYIKATATLMCGDEKIENVGYAREALDKKGMDDAQITGCTSSYARKYALNGIFAIDDTKDSDSDEHQAEGNARAKKQARNDKPLDPMTDEQRKRLMAYYQGQTDEQRLNHASSFLKRRIESFNQINKTEASQMIDAWEKYLRDKSNA